MSCTSWCVISELYQTIISRNWSINHPCWVLRCCDFWEVRISDPWAPDSTYKENVESSQSPHICDHCHLHADVRGCPGAFLWALITSFVWISTLQYLSFSDLPETVFFHNLLKISGFFVWDQVQFTETNNKFAPKVGTSERLVEQPSTWAHMSVILWQVAQVAINPCDGAQRCGIWRNLAWFQEWSICWWPQYVGFSCFLF